LKEAQLNDNLRRLALRIELDAPTHERLRLAFGHACAMRVKHFIEDPRVIDCLTGLGHYLDGSLGEALRERLIAEASRLANQHQGSNSIDGCGHAAVSATYAVAHAIAGKALQTADYAAYAVVYGEGGYGAVVERGSFDTEFEWQVQCLATLAEDARANANDAR
jgi:hypothetical protein